MKEILFISKQHMDLLYKYNDSNWTDLTKNLIGIIKIKGEEND